MGLFDVALYAMFIWSKPATQRLLRALYETYAKPYLNVARQ